MATFIATTASNGPRLKDPEAARTVAARYYWEGDIEVAIEIDRSDGQPHLAVYGYDWPGCWKIPDGTNRNDFEPDYDLDTYDGFESFLLEIAPHLAEPLTIQSVGFEKCRFPLAACEWHVRPGASEIEFTGFQHSDPESESQPAAESDPPLTILDTPRRT